MRMVVIGRLSRGNKGEFQEVDGIVALVVYLREGLG